MRRTTIVDKQIGQRVRERRISLGFSQMEVSSKIDITFQQIQKYELGMNRISASRLFQLAKIFKTPVSYFFKDLDVPIKKLSATKSRALLKISKIFSDMEDKDIKNIVAIIKNVKNLLGKKS